MKSQSDKTTVTAAALLLLFVGSPASAMGRGTDKYTVQPIRSESLAIDATALPGEAAIKVRYKLACDSDRFQMAPAEVNYGGRVLRLELFAARDEAVAALGKTSVSNATATLTLLSGTDCAVTELRASIEPLFAQDQETALALAHSPYLDARPDQRLNRFTDLPILLAYSFLPARRKGNRLLRYTLFFSDEDSVESTQGTDFQMARYGRRTDAEWIYEVELDPENRALARRYQGGLITVGPFAGIGHATYAFEGRFIDGEHPVLYNVHRHNVFGDVPVTSSKGALAGHHLVPAERIQCCSAREAAMRANPWMYKVSDVELAREGKLSAPSTRYLFVSVSGSLRDAVHAVVTLEDSRESLSNEGFGSLDRLGEDLWGRQSDLGIPLNEELLAQIEQGRIHGTVTFADAISDLEYPRSVRFLPDQLRFFRIKNDSSLRYVRVDISDKFICTYSGLQTFCHF